MSENTAFRYIEHQIMWNTLAKYPGMRLSEAARLTLRQNDIDLIADHGYSFACAYIHTIKPYDSGCCDICPLDVSSIPEKYQELSTFSSGYCLHGLMMVWTNMTNMINDWDDCTYSSTTIFKLGGGTLALAKELCSKYANAIADLKPKEDIPIK